MVKYAAYWNTNWNSYYRFIFVYITLIQSNSGSTARYLIEIFNKDGSLEGSWREELRLFQTTLLIWGDWSTYSSQENISSKDLLISRNMKNLSENQLISGEGLVMVSGADSVYDRFDCTLRFFGGSAEYSNNFIPFTIIRGLL